ncbi:MAG TPA: ABC transporter permease [Gemmatimonadaceae bacterium]|nr:ABC transporter permease [Gemmatimonadaceae bacterium]
MSLLARIRSAWRTLFAANELERDLDDELRAYVELLVAEKVRSGMTPDEARRAALREAGGLDQVKEEVRGARAGASVETALRDLRFGLRLLARSPGFAATAVLTIALGIGANSAIFSVINAVALQPLGYPAPERLIFITSQFPTLGFDKFWVSPPEFFELRERSRSFGDIAAYTTGAVNLSDGSRPERVSAVFATSNMLGVLGVRPMLGRPFSDEEDRPNAAPVAVLSSELWRRSFGGDPGIVGRTIEVGGQRTTVVGIAPPGFDLHDARAQIWMPLGLDPANRQNRGSHFLYLVGRLAPGATESGARAELRTLVRQWGQLNPGTHVPNDSTHRLQMAPLRDEVIGNVRTALWTLQGAVGFVLLIACANVANLLLARAESRHKELAIRTALGAGRGRILRQFITEGIVLALIGAVLGLGLAWWGLRALLAANPESIPRAAEIGLDPTVLAFTMGVAVLTGVVFGLAPLLHIGDRAVTSAIKDGGARSTATGARNRVRRGLVIAETALAVVLVIGAGLLLRSFRNLTSVDAGFDPRGLVTFGVVLPQATYPDAQQRASFLGELTRRLAQIPGVERVAAVQGLPPVRQVNANDTEFEGVSREPGAPPQNVDYYQTTTADYFGATGIRIVRGRGFTAADAGGAPVVVINEALARTFYPGQDPIGRRVRPSFGGDVPWFTIVGVARDVKQGGLDAKVGTELYFAYEQLPRVASFAPAQMNIVLRSRRPLEALAPGIRQTMSAMDPSLPIVKMRTMEAVFGESVTRQRFLAQLLGIFAGVALLLAAVGTYGILAYMVTERQREIGIRMALGAGRAQVVRLILRQGLVTAAAGIGIGIAGALLLSRLTTSLLFGVSPVDPLTFTTVAAVIAVVAVAACLVPTRRATRVDPLLAIRAE